MKRIVFIGLFLLLSSCYVGPPMAYGPPPPPYGYYPPPPAYYGAPPVSLGFGFWGRR